MSKRYDVLTAVTALIAFALPDADVVGEDDEDRPARVGANGRVVVRAGDPGEPEMDLSPLTYNWSHRIPIEVILAAGDNESAGRLLDQAVEMIGAAIIADRHLGGLCLWLDAEAPATERLIMDGGAQPHGADLTLVAHYSTNSPTG